MTPPKPHDWRKNAALSSENLTGFGERRMCSTLRWLCIADFQGAKNAGASGWRQLSGVRFCVQKLIVSFGSASSRYEIVMDIGKLPPKIPVCPTLEDP